MRVPNLIFFHLTCTLSRLWVSLRKVASLEGAGLAEMRWSA